MLRCVFNSISKVKVLNELLKDIGCTNVDYEIKEGYYALGYSSETFPIEGPDAIGESIFTNLLIAPNPVSDKLIIDGAPNNTTVNIYNISGSLLGKHIINTGNNTLDFSQFDAGIYIINLENDNQIITKKIIKNN